MSTTMSTEHGAPTTIYIANVQQPDIHGGSWLQRAFRTRDAAERVCREGLNEYLREQELEIIEGESLEDATERCQEADNFSNYDEKQFEVWLTTLELGD